MSYPRNIRMRFRPLSVREAAKLLGMSPQRLGFFIRNGDIRAHTLNGHDYVLWRDDVYEFMRKRRSLPGHPSKPEIAARRPPRYKDKNVATLTPTTPQQLARAARVSGQPELSESAALGAPADPAM